MSVAGASSGYYVLLFFIAGGLMALNLTTVFMAGRTYDIAMRDFENWAKTNAPTATRDQAMNLYRTATLQTKAVNAQMAQAQGVENMAFANELNAGLNVAGAFRRR
jgi:hypothetical protein